MKRTVKKLGFYNLSISVEGGNNLYIRQESGKNNIGDICITFTSVPCDWVTVVAEQIDNSF